MGLMMRHLIFLLALSLLTGCLGGVKVKPAHAVYDFGLEPSAESSIADTPVRIETISAVDPLNSNRIRYRLNYQNPAQVLSYTESRWAAQPADLLSAMAGTSTSQSPCMLQLQLMAFDQVFDNPASSYGIVQMNAVLKDKKTRKVVSHRKIQEQIAAPSADAKGGVAALKQASSIALDKALNWGNEAAASRDICR
jgi:ABC-type uncharacterized transport system auxiliary subunit